MMKATRLATRLGTLVLLGLSEGRIAGRRCSKCFWPGITVPRGVLTCDRGEFPIVIPKCFLCSREYEPMKATVSKDGGYRILEIPKADMQYVSDGMAPLALTSRYGDCFLIEETNGSYRVHCLRYFDGRNKWTEKDEEVWAKREDELLEIERNYLTTIFRPVRNKAAKKGTGETSLKTYPMRLRYRSHRVLRPGGKDWGCWVEYTERKWVEYTASKKKLKEIESVPLMPTEYAIPSPIVAVRRTKAQIIELFGGELVPPTPNTFELREVRAWGKGFKEHTVLVVSGGTGDYWIRRFRYEEKLIRYKPKGKPTYKEVAVLPTEPADGAEEAMHKSIGRGELPAPWDALTGLPATPEQGSTRGLYRELKRQARHDPDKVVSLTEILAGIKQDQDLTNYLAKVKRSAVIEGKAVTDSVCTHHWLIESQRGPTSVGICKLCRGIKEFSNNYETVYARVKRQEKMEVANLKGVIT